ncbi:MAG TPA: glutamine amidotransferase [Polyangia bacterium]|jgi:uncharacterized membrane protein|nr:glutamine amidotransferase [Polyangia bacterium]
MNPIKSPVPASVTETISEWHIELQAPWGRAALVAGLVCAALILVLAVIGLWRERRSVRRWTLLGLRVGATAMALLLFLQPAVVFQDVTRVPNHVAVLVDASESMGLAEQAGAPSRLARASALLARSSGVIEGWRKEHRVDFYTFGNELAPATEQGLAHASGPEARSPSTRLREALAELRMRYEGRDLGGVVVLSDGIDNGRLGATSTAAKTPKTEALDADSQDFLRALGVPVHTLWAGSAGLRDVTLVRVLADDFAFARNVVKVEVVIRVSGAAEAGWTGRTLPITLSRDGAPVASSSIVIDPEQPEQKVSFEFTPDRVGKYIYHVAAPVLEGEAISDNNSRTFLLKVIRDKIRALLVAGRPSWDERFLRGLLKHDPNVDLISFFILRTPTDIDTAPEEMSLIPFPTEELFLEQLRSFDVVFLQNFNFGPYGIAPYLGELKRYVEEGGGLVMLGGDLSFSLGGYPHTPVADVLPVELIDDALPDRLVSLETFRPQLTPEAKGHPIMALRPGVRENQQLWDSLPPLEGCNLVLRARPGATVLLNHPFLRTSDGQPLPILAGSDMGKGRALALMSDSSWRWGFGAADRLAEDARGRAYQRFWENAIRWLIKDPELGLLRVEAEQPEYARGEEVRAVVRVREADYRPARGAKVALTLSKSGGGQVLERTLTTDDQGQATVELGKLPSGGYRLTAKRAAGGGLLAMNQDEDVFLVRGAGIEAEQPEARPEVLRAVAEATQGSFREVEAGMAGMSFLPPRVVKVSQFHDVELWSTWLSLLAAVACFSAEWWLRRRWGLS